MAPTLSHEAAEEKADIDPEEAVLTQSRLKVWTQVWQFPILLCILIENAL